MAEPSAVKRLAHTDTFTFPENRGRPGPAAPPAPALSAQPMKTRPVNPGPVAESSSADVVNPLPVVPVRAHSPVMPPVPPSPPAEPAKAPIREPDAPQGSAEVPVSSGPAYAEQNSRYTRVEVPSRFYFYPFKTLSVRTIMGAEQAKFNRAAKEQRLAHMVDAISATMEPGLSAYDLTVPDFNWLLYWQRLNSFTKLAFIVPLTCSDPDHVTQVLEGKLDKKTLLTDHLVTKPSLKETLLTLEQFTALPVEVGGYPIRPPTMRDAVEIDELRADEEIDEEVSFLSELAVLLAPPPNVTTSTIKMRIDAVRNMSPDACQELVDYATQVASYGVDESVVTTCKECGAEITSQVVIEALTFLPALQRTAGA